MLPNFLIIGAARSGTSTLYKYMQSHPDIYLREQKRPEPHFFFKKSEYDKGLDYYEKTWFPAQGEWHAVGEASTSYLFGPDVPGRIATYLPDARLIAVLRNPIDRTFSNYWHTVKSGIETLDFDSAIEQEEERSAAEGALAELKPFAYVGRSLYHRQLVNFLSVIDHEKMAVVMFEDLIDDTRDTLRKIYQFLEVDPNILPDRFDLAENQSVPDGMVMSDETRRRLVRIFEKEVDGLSTLLGRDLSHWLR